jgi:hypothetical protein
MHTYGRWRDVDVAGPDDWLLLVQVAHVCAELGHPLFFLSQILSVISTALQQEEGVSNLQVLSCVHDICANQVTVDKLEGHYTTLGRWIAREFVVDAQRLNL